MCDDRSFHHLLVQLRAGDDCAARQVVQCFSQRLLALARRHLESWVRRTEDPEDVVQSVYQSFFAHVREGRFDLFTWNDLWSLLTSITLHKCADRTDYARARRRHFRREVSLWLAGDSPGEVGTLADRAPTPLEALLLTETVEKLLRAFANEDRPIVELSLLGYTAAEISRRLGRAGRTVRRVRKRIQKYLRQSQAAGQSGPAALAGQSSAAPRPTSHATPPPRPRPLS